MTEERISEYRRSDLRLDSLTFIHTRDCDADDSYLGVWSTYREPSGPDEKLVDRKTLYVLDHKGHWRDAQGRLQPAPDLENYRFVYANELQFTFHDNGHEKIAYALQDHARLVRIHNGEVWSMGVSCEATVIHVPTGRRVEGYESGGLWGIASDDGEYFREVEREQAEDVKDMLAADGIDTTEFDTMVANAKRRTEDI